MGPTPKRNCISETIALESCSQVDEEHDDVGFPEDTNFANFKASDQDPDPDDLSGSSPSLSLSVSSSSSRSSSSDSSSAVSRKRPYRATRGRHSDLHVVAIAGILPSLKEILAESGALQNSERQNVRKALQLAAERGFDCWSAGPNQVYKSIRSVENAIINLYYNSVVAQIANG